MTPVNSSRHYQGPGLGEAMWRCPSCGAENMGSIAGGCGMCGAGTPGQKVEAPPPPPPDLEPGPEIVGDTADHWAANHPDASIAAAYRAGYLQGVYEAQQKRLDQKPPETFPVEGKVGRTIVAALMVFRDQVLATDPEEITSGEWLSVEEVTHLIRQINQQVQVPHV